MIENEILAKYKLSQQEHDEKYDEIKRAWTQNKHPVEKPVAVIIGGQTGAGKSGIIGYSLKMFADGNVVVINSDEIKPHHPKNDEIASMYPNLYTKITDQESNSWTSRLFGELREEHYNLIFEGTMWNRRVADDAIADLIKLGYTVVVRGISVGNLDSKYSVIDRYAKQKQEKGFGRLVAIEHHDRTYNGMPDTINYIQNKGFYSVLEILSRGAIPSEPNLIYADLNASKGADIEALANNNKIDKEYISTINNHNHFNSAYDALMAGREESNNAWLNSKTKAERFTSILVSDMPEIEANVVDLEDTYKKFNNDSGEKQKQ